MNIAFVLPDGLSLGGVTTFSLEMCHRLAGLNKSVYLIEHTSNNPGLEVALTPDVKRVSCLEKAHPDDPLILKKHITRYLSCYRKVLPGVIIPNWSYGTYATCAAITAIDPESVRIIGFAHTDEQIYYDWLSYYETIIHRFVCVSDEISNKLKKKLPHRQQDIVTKPYAVHVPPISGREYSRVPTPIKIIYAGRISQRQKRIFDLILLVSNLLQEGVNFQLRIIGNGTEKARLQKKLESLGSEAHQRVTIEDSLLPTSMPVAWRAADVFISVSEYEGTSIALLEAMSHGCVPIVTEVSGTKAIIKNGVNGFRVPIGSVDQMALMIKELDRDREKLAWLGIEAHATIAHRFTYDEYITWFLKTVDDVWSEQARPWPMNIPTLPPSLKTITRTDIFDSLQGDRNAIWILLLKMLDRLGIRWLYSIVKGQ
jgi:glycosyltransferase involved in cell wall biosynthesis